MNFFPIYVSWREAQAVDWVVVVVVVGGPLELRTRKRGIRKLDWREEERSNEAIQQAIRLRGINNDCSNLSTHTLFAVHSVYL